MQNQKSIIIILFAAIFFTHCKKQTFINDTGTNYFMVAMQGPPGGDNIITATRHNENPQNVIISEDSILFKQAGLYHFEGNIYLDCDRINTSYPVSYLVYLHVNGRNYSVAQGHTQRNGLSEEGGSYFSIDVPVAANGGVYLQKFIGNSTVGLVLIRWNGYLIRKM